MRPRTDNISGDAQNANKNSNKLLIFPENILKKIQSCLFTRSMIFLPGIFNLNER
jgi:hypothetical protein